MRQHNLFGDNATPITHKIIIKEIHPVMKTVVIREDAPLWVTTRFTSPAQVFEMFRELNNETKEHFITLHLDGKNRIVCKETVSIGSLNQSIVHPREVFKTALLSNAAAILLLHNHPTGDPAPSQEDLAITKRLMECGDILGIRVLDHIIIGEDCFKSFSEDGLMK
jgi:DNA repair protein RadC